MPVAGCAALQALRDLGDVSRGARVLIHGGAGGVGHFAVQIAKALGAVTTATCGPSNVEFVRSLGTDAVINYHQRDFFAGEDTYDVVFDAVGKSSFSVCRKILRAGRHLYHDVAEPGVLPLERHSEVCEDIRQRQAGQAAHGSSQQRRSRVSRSTGGRGKTEAGRKR